MPSYVLRCTGAEACATIMIPVAQGFLTVLRPIPNAADLSPRSGKGGP